jgi:hypothetical protein
MAWFCFWVVAVWNSEIGGTGPSNRWKTAAWTGDLWSPAARGARSRRVLPPLAVMPPISQFIDILVY